jgi:hypothetical protein
MKNFDREFEWNSYKGVIKIKDMDDLHLVNALHFLLHKRNKIKHVTLGELKEDYNDALYQLTCEMKYRDIPEVLLKEAPYAFEDDQGNIRKWNYNSNSFEVVPPSLRYIKE